MDTSFRSLLSHNVIKQYFFNKVHTTPRIGLATNWTVHRGGGTQILGITSNDVSSVSLAKCLWKWTLACGRTILLSYVVILSSSGFCWTESIIVPMQMRLTPKERSIERYHASRSATLVDQPRQQGQTDSVSTYNWCKLNLHTQKLIVWNGGPGNVRVLLVLCATNTLA